MLAVFLVAAALWTGAIVFQTAVVAPVVFRTLDDAAARGFLRGLFPAFYRFGLLCGLVMLVAVGVGLLSSFEPVLVALAGATLLMLAMNAVSLRLVPAINAARDAGDAGAARFHRLHRLSVILTLIVLVLGLVSLALIGLRTDLEAGS